VMRYGCIRVLVEYGYNRTMLHVMVALWVETMTFENVKNKRTTHTAAKGIVED
jgi:hypothetical protein